jgi:hypothetical protein
LLQSNSLANKISEERLFTPGAVAAAYGSGDEVSRAEGQLSTLLRHSARPISVSGLFPKLPPRDAMQTRADPSVFMEVGGEWFLMGTRGCRTATQESPAYLEFFGYGTTTPEELRTVAKVSY